MFFWILLLAHEIADFPLQIDQIYRLKRTSRWGVIPHIIICTIVNIIILIPFLSSGKVWLAIIILSVVHFLLDKTKVAVYSKASGDNFSNFLFDQFFHILSIWIVSRWLALTIEYNFFTLPDIYNNFSFIFASSLFVFASFGGTPIVFYAQNYWSHKKYNSHVKYPTGTERMTGILERGFATTAIIIGGWVFLIAPIIFIPRYILKKSISSDVKLVAGLTGLAISVFCGIVYHVGIRT